MKGVKIVLLDKSKRNTVKLIGDYQGLKFFRTISDSTSTQVDKEAINEDKTFNRKPNQAVRELVLK